jgi:hypothetical protein
MVPSDRTETDRRLRRRLTWLVLLLLAVACMTLFLTWRQERDVVNSVVGSQAAVGQSPKEQLPTAPNSARLGIPPVSELPAEPYANAGALDTFAEDQILTRVQSAMKSQSAETILGALYFVESCLDKISSTSGLGNLRPLNLRDEKVREFEESNRALKQRCSGLMRIRLDDLLSEKKRWLKFLEQEGTKGNDKNLYVLGGGASSLELRMHQEARELVQSSGPEALFWAQGALAEIVVHQSRGGVFPSESPLADSSHIFLAFELARCELGFDCGPTSFRTLMFCSGVGLCANGLRQAVLDSFESDTQRSVAVAQARVIAGALRQRDASALGLSAQQYRAQVQLGPNIGKQ